MPERAPSLPPGHRVLRLDSVGSTNAEAARLGLAGETGPLWIVAERQTAGRGRSGRVWTSEPGNLFASLLVTLSPAAAPRAYQLSLVAGVAAAEAIRATGCLEPGASLRLKWPNDILIGRAKTGGILVESSSSGGGLKAVIGIGLNIASHPPDTAIPATHLSEHGILPSREILFAHLATAVAEWLRRWQEGAEFAVVRTAWLERAGPIGEFCSVHYGQDRVAGRFAGLDGDGALLIEFSNGQTQRYTFGDVTLSP